MASKKQSATKRILSEAKELSRARGADGIAAGPVEDDMFTFHFTLAGPKGTAFEGGLYHGKIELPSSYPFAPPDLMWLTPNGRWETQKKICLTFTGYHSESWQPAWGVRTALLAVQALMGVEDSSTMGIGSIQSPESERLRLARLSRRWTCSVCQKCNQDLLREAEGSGEAHATERPEPPTAAQPLDCMPSSSFSRAPLDDTTSSQGINGLPPHASSPSSSTVAASPLPSTAVSAHTTLPKPTDALSDEVAASASLPAGGSEPPVTIASSPAAGATSMTAAAANAAPDPAASSTLQPPLSPASPVEVPRNLSETNQDGQQVSVSSASTYHADAPTPNEASKEPTPSQPVTGSITSAPVPALAPALAPVPTPAPPIPAPPIPAPQSPVASTDDLNRIPQFPSMVLRQRQRQQESSGIATQVLHGRSLTREPSAQFLQVQLLTSRRTQLLAKRHRLDALIALLSFFLVIVLLRWVVVPALNSTGTELTARSAPPSSHGWGLANDW